MTTMDDYLDSPMDADDIFPCKGCGEILEEGKAFELAGNRWHLNCFRCNTCGTLLDSDANLLLLGDGSLICNNCTYSCSACHNKIEDLAILTGDQAFCATCFRCRNCKRKIENLRYARTSQGIFCMSCHESLMARRRKKSKAAAQAKAREKDTSPMITDKSLPALPPNAIPPNAFGMENETPESDTPTELSPRPRAAYSRNDSDPRSSFLRERSPDRGIEQQGNEGSLDLPKSYRNNRNSSIMVPAGDMNFGDADGSFIHVALGLDNGPIPSSNPRSSDNLSEKLGSDRDYFNNQRDSVDKWSESQMSTPHIALQEARRNTVSDLENAPPVKEPSRKLSKSSRAGKDGLKTSTIITDDHIRKPPGGRGDEFKLQEAPKSKRLVSSRNNSQSGKSSDSGTNYRNSNGLLLQQKAKDSPQLMESPHSLNANDKSLTPRSSPESRTRDEDDVRQSIDSLVPSRTETSGPRPSRDVPPPRAPRNANGKPDLVPPPRPSIPESKPTETYMKPRAPPQPPTQGNKDAAAAGQGQGQGENSPKLPRWSAGGDFSMDEDMARILGTDEGSSSILRRVSNAVRHGRTNSIDSSAHAVGRIAHGRSMSETTHSTISPRAPKTPIAENPHGNNQAQDISSPLSIGGPQDDPAFLKRQLRHSEQRVAELERQFNNEADLKTLNRKLIEKRKTVTVLDTQAEIMVRELEVLARVVEKGKQNNQPVDGRDLQETVLRELRHKIEKYTQSMTATIEQLIAERDQLIEEKNRATADRDRALLEFEQLSSKNAQLADMNNDLTHQIQGRFRSQANNEVKSPNGLGIYQAQKLTPGAGANFDSASIQTGATLVTTDMDEPILEGPTVVNIRKGQVKKFNWKKGKAVAQNFTKGVNRAVGAFQQEKERGGPGSQPYGGLAADSIGMPYNMTVAQVESPASLGPNGSQNRLPSDNNINSRQGFGFFGKKPSPHPMPKSISAANMSTASIAPEPPSVLFGSELVERTDFERRLIPSVVTRCIEEVELRGMDMEGIYRKTGGNSQVRALQEGFDKNDDFDISDPSLDITAVTSVLKQYFRKLPTPLLTYDVYDRVLESNSITNTKERCEHLRMTFNMLPTQHSQCLEFLMFHLARVAARESENLMPPKNLAVVFAPTLMRDHSLEKDMIDMHSKNIAVQFVIENSHIIFEEA